MRFQRGGAMTRQRAANSSSPIAVTRGMAFALVTAACIPQAALGENLNIINRRDQAREAFLAAPQGIFRHYCAHCHGEDAKGGGRLWASDLSPEPPDLTVLNDKQYVIAVIRNGSEAQGKSNLCPPWGRTISPANVERLAQYIFSLRGKNSPPPPGPVTDVRETFPWLLVSLLLGQAVVLWRMLRRKRRTSNAVS